MNNVGSFTRDRKKLIPVLMEANVVAVIKQVRCALLLQGTSPEREKKKRRFYVIESGVWRRMCKMNNKKTLQYFVALEEVTDIGNINALVKRCA
jgi:hypothetical protein